MEAGFAVDGVTAGDIRTAGNRHDDGSTERNAAGGDGVKVAAVIGEDTAAAGYLAGMAGINLHRSGRRLFKLGGNGQVRSDILQDKAVHAFRRLDLHPVDDPVTDG